MGFPQDAIHDFHSLSDGPDQSCAAADAIAPVQLVAIEARIARLTALKADLQRMLVQCAGGVIADCRMIEVLGDHAKCHADHAPAGHQTKVARYVHPDCGALRRCGTGQNRRVLCRLGLNAVGGAGAATGSRPCLACGFRLAAATDPF